MGTTLPRTLGLALLLCLAAGCSWAQAPASAEQAVSTSPPVLPLPGREGFTGVWQLIPLDDAWMHRHGAPADLEQWYLALDGPPPVEVDMHPTCPLPSRIFVGAFGDEYVEQRGLLRCVGVCPQPEGAPQLWGPHTRLGKVSVRHLDDPAVLAVDVFFYHSEQASSLTEALGIVGAVRVWELRFEMKEIVGALKPGRFEGCIPKE